MKLYSYIQSNLNDNMLHGTINYFHYINKFSKLCMFLFLFFIGVFLLKKIKLFYFKNTYSNSMYITDRIYLSPSQYFCILHVEKVRFLLSITANSIRVIQTLPVSKEVATKKNKPCSWHTMLVYVLKSIFFWFR